MTNNSPTSVTTIDITDESRSYQISWLIFKSDLLLVSYLKYIRRGAIFDMTTVLAHIMTFSWSWFINRGRGSGRTYFDWCINLVECLRHSWSSAWYFYVCEWVRVSLLLPLIYILIYKNLFFISIYWGYGDIPFYNRMRQSPTIVEQHSKNHEPLSSEPKKPETCRITLSLRVYSTLDKNLPKLNRLIPMGINILGSYLTDIKRNLISIIFIFENNNQS